MPFRDRIDAGRRLAAALSVFKGQECVVLALPRGGVPIAAEVASVLDAPLDIILVRKIGAPQHPELAIGAVVDGGKPIIVKNDDVILITGTTDQVFANICANELAEIERRRRLYLPGRAPLDPKDRIAIVVDDGIATGATMRAALQATRMRRPKKLVLAVPVASPDTLEELQSEADQIFCLESPSAFGSVGYYYHDFSQVSDEEVISILSHQGPAQNTS